ncbi:MAG: phosphohistidine phosphatase [Thiomicrorhabdus sp.]|nr:MAG: phosphohistidine phosphatase [Thiomicrorhabdus sp.]
MPNKLRELILLRHAKSEWKNTDLADIDRPLSDKGKKSAVKLGKWLKSESLIPDLILVSPAKRAQQTLRRICSENSVNTITMDNLYLADLTMLLQILAETPNTKRVMIIGHNQGLERLLSYLQHSDSDTPPSQNPEHKSVNLFPTASMAHFILPDDWTALEPGDGKLIQFMRAKETPLSTPVS